MSNFYLFSNKHSQWMIENLDPYQFKVYYYMITSVIRTKKISRKFKNGEECFSMYHNGAVLPVNISIRQTASKLSISPAKVQDVINSLCDIGCVIKVNISKSNNIYIVGIANRFWSKEYTEEEYYFAESSFLRENQVIDESIIAFIRDNRRDANKLLKTKSKIGDKFLLELLFEPNKDIINDKKLYAVNQ